jgi:hypothetical protein
LIILATALLLSAQIARADSLSLTVVTPVFGNPGDIVSFAGTIVAPGANAGVVYLNSDALNLVGPFTLDDSPFILNAPLSMAPGATYTGVLFTVSISQQAAIGAYTGFFTILGGSNPSAMDQLSNTASFEVVVVPEPATALLLGTGLAGIALRAGRQRKNKASGSHH